MVDELYDRGYQAGRAELNTAVTALARRLRDAIVPALAAIYHFEWDAPWDSKPDSAAKT